MFHENPIPILEFDDDRDALINPAIYAGNSFAAERLVITFFPEVVEKMVGEGLLRLERVIPGENPVTVYAFADQPDILLTLGQIGCPACAGNLDMFWGMGIRKVMFCGGGGVLDDSMDVGQLLLVEGAIRDEGFSYHYFHPSRCIYTEESVTQTVAACLEREGIPYRQGLAWTTDAIFRETRARIAARKAEGAKIVEMEQAGCIAVALFRGMRYGAILYGGDDVSGDVWSNRDWRSRNGIRWDLVMLCRKIAGEI